MKDQNTTKQQLIAENEKLRQQVATLVSERRQAEEALRASEERFRVAFEEAPVGMVIGVGEQVITKVNRALCHMSGYAEQELLGQRVTDFIHPEDRELYAPWTARLFAGEIPGFTNEKRYLRKDGETFWARTTAHAFRSPNEKVAFALGIVEDVTDRKRAEDNQIAGLMENITARTRAQAALERERQSLWQMLKASDHERQMISYEIHDGLAQDLAAAAMHFQGHELLRVSLPEEAERSYRTAVELVRQSHVEARRLISDLRPPVGDEIGLETAISHLVHEQQRRGGPEIECNSSVHKRLPSILENALYRIAQEALTNACKHSQSEKVTISLVQEGENVRLEVRDWGTGFEPPSVPAGHFGLEGIRRRVQLLGGRTTIESRTGTGTRIEVVVPVVENQGANNAIAQPKRLEDLQRAFFHDVLNTAGCIAGYAAHLRQEKRSIDVACDWLVRLSDELIEEIKTQRELLATESGDLTVQVDMILTNSLLDDLRSYYVKNPVAAGRGIELRHVWAGVIWTDRQLLLRVLGNMLKNGLEATSQGQTVTMDCFDHGEEVVFAVHNPTTIPEQVQLQVFERYSSTKGQSGRGIGTYSMKLIGEQFLGGKVEFVSQSPEGTTFTLTLPKSRRKH